MSENRFYRWRPHPWHGLSPGPEPPIRMHAYIEITPFDLVKYEIDKETGYLHVDRPQRTSSNPPTLYGFIPRTYCGKRVGAVHEAGIMGDGDPLDICVVSERAITHSDVILTVRVVGGFPTIDSGKADDKLVAVLENDSFWGDISDVSELPAGLIERLRHYFSTYKTIPGKEQTVTVRDTYGKEKAMHLVEAAMLDYEEVYGKFIKSFEEAG